MRPQPVRVAIDLETTGLIPEQDAIIEIGAVKFAGERVLDTFETFVASRAPLPYRVQRLTGIKPEQLRDAPAIGAVLPRLRAFVGDAPLVGHNVQFDATFLRRVGVARHNPLVDTYELASMLLPSLHSYTLASVAAQLGVTSSTLHRALADAHLSREVFLALLQRLDDLDDGVRDMLGELASPPEWTPRYFLRSGRPRPGSRQSGSFGGLLSTTLGSQFAAKLGVNPDVLAFAVARGDSQEAPQADVTEAEDEAESRGDPPVGLASVSTGVAAKLETGGILLAEVEEGDDSLLAVVAPAVRWAAQTGGRVWLCVAESDEMARLARQVLPRAYRQAGVSSADVGVAELDERSTYLCLHRWFGLARTPYDTTFSQDVARGLAKLTVWAHGTATGARSDVAIGGLEMAAWDRTRADDEYADAVKSCAYKREGYCFVARGQERAEAARIVVTTHAALGAWLAGTESHLPEATSVIVLDAHHLEEGLRRSLGFTLRRQEIQALLASLAETRPDSKRAGLLHLVAAHLERARSQARERAWFEDVRRAQECVEQLFATCGRLLPESQGKPADSFPGRDEGLDQRMLRLDARARELGSWPSVERTWTELSQHWSRLSKLLREIATQVADTPGDAPLTASAFAAELRATAHRLDRLHEQGKAIFEGAGEEDFVQWLRLPYPENNGGDRQPRQPRDRRRQQSRPEARVAQDQQEAATSEQATDASPDAGEEPAAQEITPEINQARISIGSLLAPLYAPGRSLVLASSALSVAGEFEHVRGYFGLPDATATAGYGADRAEQTLLGLPEDVPEPNAPHYQHHLDEALVRLASALDGRLVAVFPSHAALRAAWQGIRRTLERQDILVLAQGQDGSARQLWQTFASEQRVVLLGAGVFWHGASHADHPPACVVVTRLPFPALSDPLLAARSEQWADPQSQFVVPQAALRVRQALNGLAWSHRQRNAVVLFDRRVQTRGYGQTILGTLPRCAQHQEPVARLTERIAEWVGPA